MTELFGAQTVGKKVGRYQIVRQLGSGATSKVYLALDPFAGRQVALKVVFPEALKNPEEGAFYRNMFLNEAALAGKLVHPHIAQIYDAVVEDQYSYIVMEYVEGGTLEQFCKPDSLLEPAEAAEIVFKCVRALAFAHGKGLTHRDIKPGNILHSGKAHIKLADFGLAIDKSSERTVLAGAGSPAYMAPELLAGVADASELTDIYALGVVMYDLLAGRHPFIADNTASMTYQAVHTDPEPPSAHRRGVSAELDAITMRAISRDPKKRYPSWDVFGQELVQSWKQELKLQEDREAPDTMRFDALRGLSFFKGFPEEELWEVLAISKWALFPAGTAIIKEADIGDACFVIVSGFVQVSRGKRKLGVLTVGDCFGEMAYMAEQGSARSATVTTTSECILMKISSSDLRAASVYCKVLFDQQFVRVLISRLDAANRLIEQVPEPQPAATP
ncbi:MAG TPA: serine/threonine-protein kinase [Usitatibacter sp.]|nr:serine/threonine-protein kinase [Usitatibacter sp.]